VSKATAQLPAAVTDKINAVVLFGNPNGPDTPVPNVDQANTKIFCALGDNICAGGNLILPAHLSYGSDVGDAADFVQGKVTV
jgi:cutinase